MGWCTDLFCNINFHKKTYNSKYEVNSEIDDLNKMISYLEKKIHALALMTEPNKFFNDPDEDIMQRIINDVDDYLEELKENCIERFKLYLLLDNWETCHNKDGLAIDPPEGIKYDSAFLSGDFIHSEKYPNTCIE